MGVPTSGELQLYGDIGVELGVPQSNVSLGAMSDSAGFAAPDAMSDFYGYVDAVVPYVVTNSISNVGETTMRLNGNVTSDGGAAIIERGFYFGTNSSYPTGNPKYTAGGTTGAYNLTRTGLNDNTAYYCWAYATNSIGTFIGGRTNATTIESFTPIYGNAGAIKTEFILYNNSGQSGNWTAYSLLYYINPITGGYINYYNLNVNAGTVAVNNYWPAGGASFYTLSTPSGGSYVSNALNEARGQFNTTISNNLNYIGVINMELLRGSGQLYFRDYASNTGTVKMAGPGINLSTNRLYWTGGNQATSTACYIWQRFNYAT
tara:strand:- start:106 stop:1059 length:954 start_codon:yes stop_codon:yes gene_type:complete